MKKKNKFGIIIFVLVLVVAFAISVYLKNDTKLYSYEWIKEPDSVINQQRLYVNNKNNKHIEGYVRITYINDRSKKVKVSKDGKLFVKSIIKDVKIINKR